jgi:hypothetical protein
VAEIFNPNVNGGTDYLFFGYGNASVGDVTSANVTSGSSVTIATPVSEPHAFGGTSGIVMDNISTAAQASSIYFSTLASQSGTTDSATIRNITVPASGTTYTVTTTASENFATGNSVTITGVTCCTSGGSNPTLTGYMNGTFTITRGSSTTFTFTNTANPVTSSRTSNSGGTATDNTLSTTGGFEAIKLTQSGLN